MIGFCPVCKEKALRSAIFKIGVLCLTAGMLLVCAGCGRSRAEAPSAVPIALPDEPSPQIEYEGSPQFVSLDSFLAGGDVQLSIAGKTAQLAEFEEGRFAAGFAFSPYLAPQVRERAAEIVWRDAEDGKAKIEALSVSEPFLTGPRSILVYARYTADGSEERCVRMLLAWQDDGSFALAELEKNVAAVCPMTPQPVYIDPDAKIDGNYPYYITVNKLANVVTVYTLGASGEYDVPVRAMPCSTAREGFRTPLGDYELGSFRAAWCYMVDGTYGQYAWSFYQDWLFHSVCYAAKDPSTLLSEEYDLLGEVASRGCVRLQTGDAKWLFENCRVGTKVRIYEDEDPGPLGKPETAVPVIGDAANGWDPTDPRPENPWNALF